MWRVDQIHINHNELNCRCARIKIVSMIFAGYAWDRGNRMALHGIIAIVTTRTKQKPLVMLRKNYDRRWLGNNSISLNLYLFIFESIKLDLPFSFLAFRYLHYYNRYMNHMQSLKFEHKLYNCIKEKMEEMQQHNMSWIEVRIHSILFSSVKYSYQMPISRFNF